jgi:hypothetical protein
MAELTCGTAHISPAQLLVVIHAPASLITRSGSVERARHRNQA